MTLTERAVCVLYLIAGGFTSYCGTTTAQAGALWYTLGLAAVTTLLVTAAVRGYLDADERRAAAIRAERVARLRALADQREIRRAADAVLINRACCERWWTSCGCQHDSTCTRKESSR